MRRPLNPTQRKWQRAGRRAAEAVPIPDTIADKSTIDALLADARTSILGALQRHGQEAVYFGERGFLIGKLLRYEKKGIPASELRTYIKNLLTDYHRIYQSIVPLTPPPVAPPPVAPPPAPAPAPAATSTRRRRSVQKTPEWRPAPRQPVDPEDYLKKLLHNHPEQTYYGQLLRSLFMMRGVDTKNPFPAPPKPAIPVQAESLPKTSTKDKSSSQEDKKKST